MPLLFSFNPEFTFIAISLYHKTSYIGLLLLNLHTKNLLNFIGIILRLYFHNHVFVQPVLTSIRTFFCSFGKSKQFDFLCH
ncbi:hypothetical protein [Wolbachia endosymbiont (group A) of Colletes cunicularius]|uniref:hypothetical protein n=1 Tax=Wolbachia endosymbiont (group A) of Colletes cunicularius TaxID=3139321 RepID=UPI0035C938D7